MQRLAACMLGGCLADIPCVVFIRFVTQSSAIAGLRKRDRRAINSCALNRNFFFFFARKFGRFQNLVPGART